MATMSSSIGGMQLRLQREVFDPQGEQLLAMVQVVGEAKRGKRKDAWLCLLNQVQSGQFDIVISELRGGGAAADSAGGGAEAALPKKKRSWSLRSLRAIDGQHDAAAAADSCNFVLDFGPPDEAQHAFEATLAEEKKKFLSTLINLSARQHQSRGTPVSLANLAPDIVVVDAVGGSGHASTASGAAWPIVSREDEPESSYEAISSKEASDLLALMQKCEHAVTNADIFVDDLSRELNILDGANVYSIMASEENIDNLMQMLSQALTHTESIEARLNQYDDMLEHIRDSMDKMEGKTVSIETVNKNNKKLLECLEDVIKKLDLPYKYQTALSEAEFGQPRKLRECVQAAQALQRAVTADIDPSLTKMAAVQDQLKRCDKLRDRFAKSISRHLSNLFVHLGNDGDNLVETTNAGQLKLMRRKHIHQELMKYAELVHWLKDMEPKSFAVLQTTYRQNLCKLYEKDVHKFFDMARFRVSGGNAPSVASSSTDLAGTNVGGKKSAGTKSGGGNLLGADNDSIHSDLSLSERERFDDVLETVLTELEEICMGEQFFSINFFRMDQIDKSNPDSKKDKKVMEEARKMMAEIFPTLEVELLQFISFYERADQFFTLHALVRLSRHVLSTQDTGSFLAISFGTVLVQIKRNFDKFMQLQQRSIEEARPPRKQKCGILPFIANFEPFVATTEAIFRGSERRSDLEKWYASLVLEMCGSIARIAREHGKTPEQVVRMENFHHLHALLAQMKLGALDAQRKDMKQKYADALNAYVTQYFGRPLDKLNVFFEGIQQLVSAGVKESEIGYQLAYSKQELRKVIAIYPGREVKKGLDSLYRKVERHLCDEESLMQVVWRAMQEEFIRQYKNIEDLIQRCYPGAQISLDFTINEVLEYFSDIARSH